MKESAEQIQQYLNEKYSMLESLKGQETALKSILKAEIVAIETTLKTLKVEYKSRSCYKCADPETAAKNKFDKYICWECMMQDTE